VICGFINFWLTKCHSWNVFPLRVLNRFSRFCSITYAMPITYQSAYRPRLQLGLYMLPFTFLVNKLVWIGSQHNLLVFNVIGSHFSKLNGQWNIIFPDPLCPR